MSVRLIRQGSDTPNVSNRDDASMVRFAYGGFSGIVSGFGEEMSATLSDRTVLISKGKAVIDGWEIELDSESLTINSSSSEAYDYLYFELDLLTETVSLLTVRSTLSNFPLPLGDDLTLVPSGKARLPIYSWRVDTLNQASNLTRISPMVKSTKAHVEDIDQQLRVINQRLTDLGFKTGAAVNTVIEGSTLPLNEAFRQGNYVIGQFVVDFSALGGNSEIMWSPQEHDKFIHVCTLNKLFCPKSSIMYSGFFTRYIGSSEYFPTQGCDVKIDPDGKIYVGNIADYYANAQAESASYWIRKVHLILGHEAAPVQEENL